MPIMPPPALPPELISYIMTFVAISPAPFPVTTTNPRLQLTQVCSAWRQIAFDTPTLWDLQFPRSYHNEGPIKLAHYWWSQCTGSQLKIEVNLLPVEADPIHSHQLLEKLVFPFTHRLQVIRLTLDCSSLAKFLALSPDSLESLEKISIWLEDLNYNYPWDEQASALAAAPNVHDIYFSYPLQAQFKPSLPWGQLTRLVLVTRLSPLDFLAILSQCTCIDDGTFHEIDVIRPNITVEIGALPNFPLHLPKLRKLSIRFRSSRYSHILSRLVLPKLVQLQFGCNQGWSDSGSAFISFLQPMKTSLRHLEIKNQLGGCLDPPMYEQILGNLLHLRSFIIPFNFPLPRSTLKRISKGEVLPEVERLHFCVEYLTSAIRMLEARKSNSQPLIREIRVNPLSRFVDLTEELAELRSQGMVIDVVD